jgi:hypothetical protein
MAVASRLGEGQAELVMVSRESCEVSGVAG